MTTNRSILHVSWKGTSGGAEVFLRDLAREQQKRGWNVEILWLMSGGTFGSAAGVPFREWRMRRGWDILRAVRGHKDLLRDPPQFIHIHQISPMVLILLAVRKRWRLVFHIHTAGWSTSARRLSWGWLAARLLRSRIDVFVANSEATREYACRQLHAPQNSLRVIPNGIDAKNFDPSATGNDLRPEWGVPHDAFLVGVVGSLRPERGSDRALTVFAQFNRQMPHSYLVFVGDGPDRDILSVRVRAEGLDGHVQFVGLQSEMGDVYRTIDVLLVTPRAETFGLAIAEAMAMGIPVVGYGVGAIPEVVVDSGLLAEEGDEESCATKLLSVALWSPEKHVECARKSRARILAQYEIGVVAQELDKQIYRASADYTGAT